VVNNDASVDQTHKSDEFTDGKGGEIRASVNAEGFAFSLPKRSRT
jgi:hypothetical protein